MSGRFWGTKRSRICHHIAARSGSNTAGFSLKCGLKSRPTSAVAAVQAGQQMRVSSSFLSEKVAENASFILNFPPLFVTVERQDEGELRS